MTFKRLTLGLLAGGLCAGLATAEPATLTRASDLKAKPFTDAATVASLPEQARVDILGNDGGWTQVKTGDGKTGWVRLLNVRPVSTADGGAGIGKSIASVGNVARTGSTGATATTGTKGITVDDLAQASPNFQEVKKLDQYQVSDSDAQRFATANHLQARSVDYLEPADGTPRN